MRLLKPLIILLLISLTATTGCQQRFASGNPFIRKNPIRDCSGKVPVDRKKRKTTIGQRIDRRRNISLLTPIVVFKARQRGGLDSSYVATSSSVIRDSIESRFLRDDWVDRVIPKQYDLQGVDADSIKSMMLTYKQDTIDYRDWKVSEPFITQGSRDYSLLMVVDAIVGFDGAIVRNRFFWKPEELGKFEESEVTGNHLMFFVIDNVTRKVTFADHYVFHCDVRDNTSLQKVLEYAYLQLLEVRFRRG